MFSGGRDSLVALVLVSFRYYTTPKTTRPPAPIVLVSFRYYRAIYARSSTDRVVLVSFRYYIHYFSHLPVSQSSFSFFSLLLSHK